MTETAFELAGGDPQTKLKYYLDSDGNIRQVPSFMDINPSKVEHLFDSYLGGRFQFWNQVVTTSTDIIKGAVNAVATNDWKHLFDDVPLNTVPVLRRLYQEPWQKPYWNKYYQYRDQIEIYNTVKKQYEKVLNVDKWSTMEKQTGMQEKAAVYKSFSDLINETFMLAGSKNLPDSVRTELLQQRERYVLELVKELTRIDSLNNNTK
jgi:hypothetical protein